MDIGKRPSEENDALSTAMINKKSILKKQKNSSDKLTSSSKISASRKSYQRRINSRADWEGIGNRIDMKDPFIQKRTYLNIQQAKLMGVLVKHRLNRSRFSYMLNHLKFTKERSEMLELLKPKQLLRTTSKFTTGGNDTDSVAIDYENKLDVSEEVKKVIKEYSQIQRYFCYSILKHSLKHKIVEVG
jgi:hypothetical protein